jgi:hypothetical protein
MFNNSQFSIQNYRQEKEQRDLEIARDLEKKSLPAGMRLMEEPERLDMLRALENSKRELQTEIERLPITMKTMAMQRRREDLEERYR